MRMCGGTGGRADISTCVFLEDELPELEFKSAA